MGILFDCSHFFGGGRTVIGFSTGEAGESCRCSAHTTNIRQNNLHSKHAYPSKKFLQSARPETYSPPSFDGRWVGSSMVEQRPFKSLVPGSNPGQPTTETLASEGGAAKYYGSSAANDA